MTGSVTPYQSRHLQPITSLPGIGAATAAKFARKGIHTIEDLLMTLPIRYDDRRRITPIGKAEIGTRGVFAGELARVRRRGGRGHIRHTTAELVDDTGRIEIVWFGFSGNAFADGQRVVVAGEVGARGERPQLRNPAARRCQDETPCEIVPVYSETEGVRQATWHKAIRAALETAAPGWVGAVPEAIRRTQNVGEIAAALRWLHEPDPAAVDEVAALSDPRHTALRSVIFEDVFAFQLSLALRRRWRIDAEGAAIAAGEDEVAPFLAGLPFALTAGQRDCWARIAADLAAPTPMRRLVHGDVGAGKTVLAGLAAYATARAGYQAVVLAPTEILADQHARRFEAWLAPLGVRTTLVTGDQKPAERRRLLDRMRLGVEQVVVGTHALLGGAVEFRRLGLVVVDEQHKFGVDQRGALIEKGENPNVLLLTATPIPRTLALTAYGDLDLSLLRDRPVSERRVKTRVVEAARREELYGWLDGRLARGERAYVVCPRLDQGDAAVRDVTATHAELTAGPLRARRVGVLHGKVGVDARDEAIGAFAAGGLDALVCTSVIEVGLDVPAAAILVVENAETFGLSQLHQMRGRIGRDGRPGACLLLTGENVAETARRRLAFLAECDDGFAVAEADLALRGPGEPLGVAQSGLPALRFARAALADIGQLEAARAAAEAVVAADPTLAAPEHEWAKMVVNQRWGALLGQGDRP